MSPDLLARLVHESLSPSGIAPAIDAPELAQLLAERAHLVNALADILPMAVDRASYLRGEWPNAATDSANDDRIAYAGRALRMTVEP